MGLLDREYFVTFKDPQTGEGLEVADASILDIQDLIEKWVALVSHTGWLQSGHGP